MTVEEMLQALVSADHEVTFLLDAHSGEYTCHIITPEGNGIVASSGTLAGALAEASPLPAPEPAPVFTSADRLLGLEIWAETVTARLNALEAAR